MAGKTVTITEKPVVRAVLIAIDVIKRQVVNPSEIELMSHYQISNTLAQDVLQVLTIQDLHHAFKRGRHE